MPTTAFNDDKWILMLRSYARTYNTIRGLLSNNEVIQQYAETEDGVHSPVLDARELQMHDLWNEDLEASTDSIGEPHWDLFQHTQLYLEKTIELGIKNYDAQFIVMCATLGEAMLQEAFFAFFANKPTAMRNFIIEEDGKVPSGYLKFSEVVRCLSREELLEHLAERACANAMKGKVEKTLKKLSDLTKRKLDDSVCKNIILMFEARNKIVHEADVMAKDIIDERPQVALLLLLNEVVLCLKNRDVPTTWKQFDIGMPVHIRTWRSE